MTTGIQQTQDSAVAYAKAAVNDEAEAAVQLTAQAEGITIETREQLEASTNLLQTVTTRKKGMTALRLSITRPMDEAKKAVMRLFAPGLEGLQHAEDSIKASVLDYNREQIRRVDEERRRLEAEAEEERKRLLTRGAMQRDIGEEEKATELEAQSDAVEATRVAPAEGLSGPVHTRVVWKAEVTDLAALALAFADWVGSPEGDSFPVMLPNMPVLNSMAKQLKNDLKIPGVRAVSEEVVAARGT